MAHTVTWDAAYEAIAADTDQANTLGDVIRDLKRDIRERMEIDHDWDDVTNAGQHKKVTLQEQGADPAIIANCGFVYTKDVAGVTELFYRDSNGAIVQITQGGLLGAGDFTLPNNKSILGKETGGTARNLVKMNAADAVEVGVSARDVIINILTAATGLGLKIGGGALKKIWHEDNDGSGSTLDADMVDGLHKTDLLTWDVAGNQFVQSAELAMVGVLAFTVNHSFTTVPRLVQACVICKVTEAGYAVGDEVLVHAERTASGVTGWSTWKSTTQAGVTRSFADMSICHKTTGAGTGITDANWRVIIRAWK